MQAKISVPPTSSPAQVPGVIPTSGEAFPEGAALELVRDPADSGRLALLFWDGKQARIVRSYQRAGSLYVPFQIDPTYTRALTLPSPPKGYGTTRALFERITDVLAGQFALPRDALRLVTHFIISTWFIDLLPIGPALLLSSPVAAEAGCLLRLLRSVCYHGLLFADLTATSFRKLPMQLRPTLLLDQSALAPPVGGLVRASNRPNVHVARPGGCVDLCCAKAIYIADNQMEWPVWESMLRVLVIPSPTRSAVLDRETESKIATELQPQLLRYRLANYWRVKAATFDVPEFLQPVRDLARSFGAAIVGDEQLQREVVPLLQQKDDEVRSQLDVQPEGTILEVLLASLHEGKAKHVLVKDIATSTNALLRMRGEILEYSPVEIGHRLTGLGLVRTTLSSGRGIRLCRAVSRIVHSLATRYGIPKPKSKKDCPDCQLSPQDLD